MKAEVYRDNAGFWMARIEEDASTPENRGIGRVYRRQMLPVAPSASKAEAEAALRRVMSREARCPHHDTDNYTQPLEAVMREERQRVYSMPLKVADRRYLFKEWCERNPKALREIELTALAIDARGLRVSTKYLIEKQRYEGTVKLVGVPFVDDQGNEHTYGINNSDSSLLARWLLERHPKLRIELRTSMFDKEKNHEA